MKGDEVGVMAKRVGKKAAKPKKQQKAAKQPKAVAKPQPKKHEVLLQNPLVREFLTVNAGENVSNIVIQADGPVSDEELARASKLKVSDVRSVLNKLHNLGLADYERSRDKDSGWYSYTWKMNLEKAYDMLRDKHAKELESLDAQLNHESTTEFYGCKRCRKDSPKMLFEQASETDFKCPKCKSVLVAADNSKTVEELAKRKGDLLKVIESLNPQETTEA